MADAEAWWKAPWNRVFAKNNSPLDRNNDRIESQPISGSQPRTAMAVHTPTYAGEAEHTSAETSVTDLAFHPYRQSILSTAPEKGYLSETPQNDPISRFIVFSDAGKLVYASGDSSEAVYAHASVLQALVAVFAYDNNDELQSICMEDELGRNAKVTLLSRTPLYVAYISSYDQPTEQIQAQLSRVYFAIVSLMSKVRLQQLFEQKPNFDLRAVLTPMQDYLDGVVASMGTSMSISLAALPVYPLDASLRANIMQTVMPSQDTQDPQRLRDVLYVSVLRHNQLVCLAHPKRHTPHQEDLALLFDMVRFGGTNASETDVWVPMCLPHAAPHGFVFVYASRLHPGADGAMLLIVMGDRDGLERAKAWRAQIQPACNDGCLRVLQEMPQREHVDALGITGLRHYAVVSQKYSQYTTVDSPYPSSVDTDRLFRLYSHSLASLQGEKYFEKAQGVMDKAHDARIAMAGPCRLQHYRTDHEAILAWRLSGYWLFVAVSPPWLSKAAIATAANKVAAYVRRKEKYLFAIAHSF
ncbi:hypothetical protein MYAM1_003016 [Malassezia yamatoensis]|uniref:Vacuolar fusion protein MON1 n=1 Tax=Malassezia yamatoensis TaxID=253288 RepID=A0AAJ5YZB7_9BASI|nr:hypothetical protein MYAM1_003016 [Malassezia yamatoensis]